MWNSAYTYPRPASSTPAVMPSLVLSAPGSTGSTSGVSNAPMLSPSESLKSRASKLRKGHKSTTQDNEVDNNTTVVIHRHKHQHHHFHHHYLHINPSIPLLNALQAADIPMLQGIIMEHMITPRAVSIPLPLSYPGTHVSNPSSLRQFPAQSDVSLYSELVAPIAGPSDEDRGFKSGRKKALCIGINYVGQDRMLHGCINDARRVRKFLIEYHGYSSDNIIILTDAGNASGVPTRKNILKCMRWLVKGARRGDSLFFHYSGHGGQVRDIDGDEVDGLDEGRVLILLTMTCMKLWWVQQDIKSRTYPALRSNRYLLDVDLP
ncbi:hypothetical protein AX15_003725 [Amanita polypyramis BW_CC]|nr:hypothetical protein AX15_003725 [Amanita polypyramis BW_CC]